MHPTHFGGKLAIDAFTRIWNRLVAQSWKYLRTDATHVHFLHPTKGFRKVSRKRLGIA